MPTLFLIDASIYIFRSWFALPDSITDTQGRPFNAAQGYIRFLLKLLQTQQPSHIACCFDESLTSSFRNKIYPGYKANRALPPTELKYQFAACRATTEGLGVAEFASHTLEADDLIASLTTLAHQHNMPVTIVSRDKDLAQCLRPGDTLWDGAEQWLSYEDIQVKYGVSPEQLPDYQALVGDKVDNIPGVAGIGPKAAASLLQAFGSLADIYQNLDNITQLDIRGSKRLQRLLEIEQSPAELSLQLTQLVTDQAPVKQAEDCRWRLPSSQNRLDVATQWTLGHKLTDAYANFTRPI